MTIFFNFCSLAASIFCFSAGFRLHRSYQKIKMEALKAYSRGFFFVGLAYFFLALPGMFVFNPVFVQVGFVLVDICFLLAIFFSAPSLLGVSEKLRHYKTYVFYFTLTYLLIYVFLSVFFFSPAFPLTRDHTIYYWKPGTPLIQSMARGFAVLCALFMSAFFFYWAKVALEKIVRYRSFFIGLGNLIIATAGFIFWFSPFFYFSPSLLIFSGFLGLSGFMIGVVNTTVFRLPKEISDSET